ncbi:hypothetical protein ACIBI4_18690 [Streptomyces sp. NPDC050418]|uniref:hypothetical protein n=1 Tax=Streptomyces sp. NPDC050418 TaxID=3365612 RepID=UPI0037A86619
MSEHRGDGPGRRPDDGQSPNGRYGRGGRGASWAGREHGPERHERHEQGEPHEQYGHHEQYEQYGQHQQHGGYGTVNGASGPEYDPDRPGQDASRQGLGPDEVALRRMMRGAVQDIAPSDDALAHLRRAVPARRARKRQAVVGMAAAALLIGTAVPAVFHVATSPASDDSLIGAGDSSNMPGEDGDAQGAGSGDTGGGKESGKDGKKDKDKGKGDDEPGTGDTASSGASAGTSPTGDASADAPVCDASMLAEPTSSTGAAHPDGSVYGSFKVANTSTSACAVGGSGSVTFAAQGAAEQTKIRVVDHAAGDPAGGLPAPSAEPGSVVLQPGQSYEVQFAWVPSAPCPTTNPSPDPSPSENAGDVGGSGQTGSDMQTQLVTEEGGTSDGSVSITHTAEPGAPTVDAKISNACAGTIYRTEALPAS